MLRGAHSSGSRRPSGPTRCGRGGGLAILGGFRVDGDAINLLKLFLYTIFQSGGHIVDLRDGQLALHGAMARDQNMMLDLPHADVVAVHQFIELRRQAVQEILDGLGELLHLLEVRVGRRDVVPLRLDVDVYVNGAVAQFADLVFQFAGLAMGLAQAQILVHFDVQLDKKAAVLLRSEERRVGKEWSAGWTSHDRKWRDV